MFSKKKFYFVLTLILILAMIVISDISIAEANTSFSTGFCHLLEITIDKTKKFDSDKIEKIIAFVNSKDFQTTPEFSGGLKNAASAYYGYNINCTMKQMLRICQNPKIPAYAVLPEAIRLAEWNKVENIKSLLNNKNHKNGLKISSTN